jgi:DNA-binding NarL/FixJ family response regulator
MNLTASGMADQELATACFISHKTVKNHISTIFTTVNASSHGEGIALRHRIARGGPADHG